MTIKHPTKVGEHIYVPDFKQTGIVKEISETECKFLTDFDSDSEKFSIDKVFCLTWKDYNTEQTGFFYVAKAWRNPFGKRKVRFQVHPVYKGRKGRRIKLLEKVAGKTVFRI